MKLIKAFMVLSCSICLLQGSAGAIEKTSSKATCCQEAAEKGKDCRHKCCVAAHREGKSCTKCNPNQEDLKLKKATQKASGISQK